MDFEEIFDAVAEVYRDSIGDAVDAMNTAKGDSLLPAFDSVKDYFKFRLPSVDSLPNRKVFFLQTLEDPQVKRIPGGTQLVLNVGIDVVINMTGDGNDERRMLRYQTIMQSISDDALIHRFRFAEVTSVTVTQMRDANSQNNYLLATTYLAVSA